MIRMSRGCPSKITALEKRTVFAVPPTSLGFLLDVCLSDPEDSAKVDQPKSLWNPVTLLPKCLL